MPVETAEVEERSKMVLRRNDLAARVMPEILLVSNDRLALCLTAVRNPTNRHRGPNKAETEMPTARGLVLVSRLGEVPLSRELEVPVYVTIE
mmetsp:Transcript_14039/g.20544  ORF Transcript_14039/g.20544 Transcript_14039/m.20544 type:complete len:92 (-) Transcript_14039:33-308(-)